MGTLKSTLVGLVAGSAAAGAWAALVIGTGTLFGALAPAIGLVVGVAMRIAATRGLARALTAADTRKLGLIASLITFCSVLGGKIVFLSGLASKNFGTTATWDQIRSPFFTSLMGIRGLYLVIAIVTAFAILATAAKTESRARAK